MTRVLSSYVHSCRGVLYPDEYPSPTSTRIILKVKPEPVAGNPGCCQTKSNGFNEYSGEPGYSDDPFSFTVINRHRKRRTGHTAIICRNESYGHQTAIIIAELRVFQIIKTRNYKKIQSACLDFCVSHECLLIISLAFRQSAAWSSTLIAHHFPERRMPRKQKETHTPSLPPFCTNFPLDCFALRHSMMSIRIYPHIYTGWSNRKIKQIYLRSADWQSFGSVLAPNLTTNRVPGPTEHFLQTPYVLDSESKSSRKTYQVPGIE